MPLGGLLLKGLPNWGLLLLASSGLLACPAPPVEKSPPRPQTSGLQIGHSGGQRLIATTALPQTFNPYLTSDAAAMAVLNQMFRGLIVTDRLTGKVQPSLAESWELSKDQRSYTFTLRSALKWSDGVPLTVADVAFTFQQVINNPLIPNNFRDFLTVKGKFPKIEILDKRRIRFTTTEPFVPFLMNLGCPIIPQHRLQPSLTLDKNGQLLFLQTWGLGTPPAHIVVNGPWKLGQFVPGQKVVLVPNPHYHIHDAQGQPLPYMREFSFLEVQDRNTALLKFRSGETDMLDVRPADYEVLQAESAAGKFTIHNLGSSNSVWFVMFNQSLAQDSQGHAVVEPQRVKWFRNLAFRKALAYGINRPAMVESIFQGRGAVIDSHISPQNPFYQKPRSAPEYNLDKARQILKKAGFGWDSQQQLRDSQGHPVTFELMTNAGNTERDTMAGILRQDWRKLGIQIDYRPVSFNALMQSIHDSHRWEVVLMSLASNPLEPHFGISRWKTDGRMHLFNMGHPNKWPGRKPTQFEPWEYQMADLYERAAGEFDRTKRRQLYGQAQELEAQHVPFLYTATELTLIAVRQRLGNIFPSLLAGGGLNAVNWNSEYHYIMNP